MLDLAKIHGRPWAARPISRPSAPVASSTPGLFRRIDIAIGKHRDRHRLLDRGDGVVLGFAGVQIGAVRPCTASAWMPACSAIFATVRPFLLSRSQPVRIFRVTGTSTAATTACRISVTSASSFNNAEPAALLQTFLPGSPC
jgi:hypothetical protein